ncbi:(3R)-3-hydroxyacyl-CoA dehydrogenase-like [Oratosquilla oratoria]|uniref:(3R)-3-hydroxyacyl-CoA dehydrogenase-like n=1 Tax=Oratosquilla oratoria TaxID=337810 RepID=UPI003F76F9CF
MAPTPAPLKGNVALVTGGGSGIGRCVCRLLDREGAKVVVADLNLESAKKTVLMLNRPNSHLAVQMDVRDQLTVQDGFAAATKTYGRPPTLIGHATGVYETGAIDNQNERAIMDIIDINLKGAYVVNQVSANFLAKAGISKGAVVNFSSLAAYEFQGHNHYAAAKAGVMAFTKTTAMKVTEHNRKGLLGYLRIHPFRGDPGNTCLLPVIQCQHPGELRGPWNHFNSAWRKHSTKGKISRSVSFREKSTS